jgi:pimeloyl-ACP methyl ester carboxylesterase
MQTTPASGKAGTTRGSIAELAVRVAADNSDHVLYRDMCIIARSYPLLAELKNLLPRKATETVQGVPSYRAQEIAEARFLDAARCETIKRFEGLSGCDASDDCVVDRQSRRCLVRRDYVDVEQGDVFQSCDEPVEFVGRWQTLATRAAKDEDKKDEDGVPVYRSQPDEHGFEAHGYSIGGVNGALLRSSEPVRFYMFVNYGEVLTQKRLEELRPAVEAFAAECLAQAGAAPLVLYGHSMGAQIIRDYVLHNLPLLQKRTNVVVLLTGTPPLRENQDALLDSIVETLSLDRFFNLATVLSTRQAKTMYGVYSEDATVRSADADDEALYGIDSFPELHPSFRLVEITADAANGTETFARWKFHPWRPDVSLKKLRFLHDFQRLFRSPARFLPRARQEVTGGERRIKRNRELLPVRRRTGRRG